MHLKIAEADKTIRPLVSLTTQPLAEKNQPGLKAHHPLLFKAFNNESLPLFESISRQAPRRDTLSSNDGSQKGQNIKGKFKKLEKEMNERWVEYEKRLKSAKTKEEKAYFIDLIKAIKTDLGELREGRKKGGNKDKVKLYNRLSYEFYLEVKYNINITSQGETWSNQDLAILDSQLQALPTKLRLYDPKLSEIRLANLPSGVGGSNNGKDLISLPSGSTTPGGIEWALLHEIGHNWDDENPNWKKFLALSGWKDVSKQFSQISNDTINGVYKPDKGTAVFNKDGKMYKDGDNIDLNDDGKTDGIVQIHYGKVMVHKENAKFINVSGKRIPYAETNPLDDFAETFKYFFKEPEKLKEQSPEKFWFMVVFTGVDTTPHPGIKLTTKQSEKPNA